MPTAVKLTDLQLIYGAAGAREKFEDVTTHLIRSERPDAERVRIFRGDGGIDAHEGTLSDPAGVDVYQIKFFATGIADSQKVQIRESFKRVRDTRAFKTRSWTLCLPIDMCLEEKKWFDEWKEKQKDTGIEIRPAWGAFQLEGVLYEEKNRHLREVFFKEEEQAKGGDVEVSSPINAGAGLDGPGGDVRIEGGTGRGGASGGNVRIGPEAVTGGDGGVGGKGGDVIIKGGDAE